MINRTLGAEAFATVNGIEMSPVQIATSGVATSTVLIEPAASSAVATSPRARGGRRWWVGKYSRKRAG